MLGHFAVLFISISISDCVLRFAVYDDTFGMNNLHTPIHYERGYEACRKVLTMSFQIIFVVASL